MKKPIIFLAIAVALGVFVYINRINNDKNEEFSDKVSPTPKSELSKIDIVYSDSGYSPSPITIKKGDVVVFKNQGTKMMWTASAFHPSHKVYPGTDIEKCGTQSGMFDACKGYGAGASWEFKFDEIGTWKYHNHLEPKHFGTIIVE